MDTVQNTDNTNADENIQQKEFHSSLVGMKNGTVTSGDRLAVSYKTKHHITITYNICTIRYLFKLT